jgi:hypothetical protein
MHNVPVPLGGSPGITVIDDYRTGIDLCPSEHRGLAAASRPT